MRLFKDKGGFVLHYKKGSHINTHSFKVKVDNSTTYGVNVGALFLPLQIHEGEKKFQREFKKISRSCKIPYGGDLFSCFVDGPYLNFFIIDIVGHGLFCHNISKRLMRYAARYPNKLNLIEEIFNIWNAEGEQVIIDSIRELEREISNAQRNGYPSNFLEILDKVKHSANKAPFVSACQFLVNLKEKQIQSKNFGHPSQYCLSTDSKGKIRWKHFPNQGMIIIHEFPFPKLDKSRPYSISPETSKFRLVMFSDAILEQEILIEPKHHDVLLAQLGDPRLQARYRKGMSAKSRQISIDNTLLIYTLKKTMMYKPEKVVEFFYDYLVRLNSKVQGDDITLVVIDFEKQ